MCCIFQKYYAQNLGRQIPIMNIAYRYYENVDFTLIGTHKFKRKLPVFLKYLVNISLNHKLTFGIKRNMCQTVSTRNGKRMETKNKLSISLNDLQSHNKQ